MPKLRLTLDEGPLNKPEQAPALLHLIILTNPCPQGSPPEPRQGQPFLPLLPFCWSAPLLRSIAPQESLWSSFSHRLLISWQTRIFKPQAKIYAAQAAPVQVSLCISPTLSPCQRWELFKDPSPTKVSRDTKLNTRGSFQNHQER